MIFGSIVAGMTSEGGGAVAFPVMTLALKEDAKTARDFSMLIQSVGMTAASFAILYMNVQVEYNSIAFCIVGSIGGSILGFHVIDKNLTPPQKKMLFVCIWFAFAFSLFLLNRRSGRKTYRQIPKMNWWKCIVLTANGFLGGIFTSFAGSGLDICSFRSDNFSQKKFFTSLN